MLRLLAPVLIATTKQPGSLVPAGENITSGMWVAKTISDLMEYKGLSVAEASKIVLEKVGKMGGDGGLIALDKKGNITMPFNTEGMYRGAITADGKIEVNIYK